MKPLIIKNVSFVKSSTRIKDCPEGAFPEYAFTGRSNVGKSSLINLLTRRAKLAKTSAAHGLHYQLATGHSAFADPLFRVV